MLKRFCIGIVVASMAMLSDVPGLGTGFIATCLAAETAAAAQTNGDGGVRITVTPINLSSATDWEFTVMLETHTRPLNDDLPKSSTLIADGKAYPALGWEGGPPGGHHRKGVLRFKAIAPRPQSAELQITLSGDDVPRKFQWFLGGAGHGN